jgi:hypothetical protein
MCQRHLQHAAKHIESVTARPVQNYPRTDLIISTRVQQALLDEKVTGWRTCPVEFKDKKGVLIENYDALGTTGRSGPLDNRRCRKVTRKALYGDAMIDTWIGYYFDEDSWDGSDMFRPDNTRMTIVTRRVKEIFDTIGATNVKWTPLLEVEQLMLL